MNKKRVRNKLIWIGLGASAILLRWMVSDQSALVEQYYSRGLFLGIRKILDFAMDLLPFPVLYILLLGEIAYLIYGIIVFIKSKNRWSYRLLSAILSVFAWTGSVAFFFLFLWGFNYARIPVEQQQSLKLMPLSEKDLAEGMDRVTEKLVAIRPIFGIDSVALSSKQFPTNLTDSIQAEVKTVFSRLNYPSKFKPKVQQLQPKGILLRWSTLGVYFPWTGECNVDAGLHPLELPHVMAHELAHSYGIGDEGTCNFIAYLACTQSQNDFIQYAGYLEYFTTLFVNYSKYDKVAALQYLRNLPPAVKADWNSIIENHQKYPNVLPKLRRATYNTYLKAQGIEEGIQNYNRVLMLVKAWEEQK